MLIADFHSLGGTAEVKLPFVILASFAGDPAPLSELGVLLIGDGKPIAPLPD